MIGFVLPVLAALGGLYDAARRWLQVSALVAGLAGVWWILKQERR